MNEEKKPFTVTDRRHFTADGQVRQEADSALEVPSREAAPRPGPDTPPPGGRGAAAAEDAADFASFVVSLGTQAGMLLDRPGEGEEAAEALRQVRYLISILEMLHGKTEGRRTADEDRILQGLLYELRMAYLARAGVSRP